MHVKAPFSLRRTLGRLALFLVSSTAFLGEAPAQVFNVSDFQNNSVLRFDAAGNFLGNIVPSGSSGLTGANGVRTGPDGNLYVASQGTNEILRFHGQTGAPLGAFVSAGSGGLLSPQEIVFGPDGNLYVASGSNDQILRYSGATGAFLGVVTTLRGPGIHDGPVIFGFAPDGMLYVGGIDGGSILRVNPANGSVAGVLASPSGFTAGWVGLAFDNNYIYAAGVDVNDPGFAGSIYRFRLSDGALLGALVPNGAGGILSPGAISLDLSGRLLALDDGDLTLKAYDPVTGALLGVVLDLGAAGSALPFYFESSAVPEPGTLVLLGGGTLALGFIRRRRAGVRNAS